MISYLRLAALVTCASACLAAPVETSSLDAEAPLLGVDGSRDQADRNCHVVLRDLQRNWTGLGYEVVGGRYVWQGTIDLSEAAAAEGLVPSVLYRTSGQGPWRSAHGTPAAGSETPGYQPFSIRISDGLPGPGTSATALDATQIEVVPFAALAQGGRLFDHNRYPGDFDNYLVASPSLAIAKAPTVCAPPAGPTRARLVFGADWSERREGVLAPGGELAIAYDGARLAQCRDSQHGLPRYDITAHVRFAPGGELRAVSVRDAAPVVAIPAGARSVELWFENTSAGGCQAWDSNLGDNYRFEALLPPAWSGEAQNRLVRDAVDPCDGGAAAATGFSFDTYVRQRAAYTNLCFQVYQPGLTDRDVPDLWQRLDAQVHWRVVGEPALHTTYAAFDRRVGNNARFTLSWRSIDPLRSYHCPAVRPTISTLPPAGHYEEVQVEYYVTVNGGELRPAPGELFRGTFVDYANDSFRAQNCTY